MVESASLGFFGSYAGPVLLIAAVGVVPLIVQGYWVGSGAQAFAYAVIFLSWTIVTGEGGMLWLCQITFAGVGALTTGQLATNHGWPVLLAVLAGGVIAMLMGVVVGLLSIRLGDLYVALVTLTFGLLMENLVFTLPDLREPGPRDHREPPRLRQLRPSPSPICAWPSSSSSRSSSSTSADRPPGWPSTRRAGARPAPGPRASAWCR